MLTVRKKLKFYTLVR